MYWLKKMNWDIALIVVVLLAIVFIFQASVPSTPAPVNTQPAQLSLIDRRADMPHLSRAYVRPTPAPTKKAVVKPKPSPTPTKTPVVTQPQSPQKPTSANVTLACIRHHESRGDYGVVSESRGGVRYYGAYQLSGTYMDDWARRYGHSSWANRPANQWPSSVQDDVALKLGRETSPDWEMWSSFTAYSCPGF